MADENAGASRKQPIAKPHMLTVFASVATSLRDAL